MSSFDFHVSRETNGELEAVAWAEGQGWEVRKVQYPNRAGCPDRFFFKGGVLVMIEFKKPKGKLSEGQKREHERLRNVGWHVYVAYDADQAIRVLKGYA